MTSIFVQSAPRCMHLKMRRGNAASLNASLDLSVIAAMRSGTEENSSVMPPGVPMSNPPAFHATISIWG